VRTLTASDHDRGLAGDLIGDDRSVLVALVSPTKRVSPTPTVRQARERQAADAVCSIVADYSPAPTTQALSGWFRRLLHRAERATQDHNWPTADKGGQRNRCVQLSHTEQRCVNWAEGRPSQLMRSHILRECHILSEFPPCRSKGFNWHHHLSG
jgi:hypothetical protein